MFSLCGSQKLGRLALVGLAAPSLCEAFFGGGGGGGYEPPPPADCKPFACPKGSKAVGESNHQMWSYGCKDAGLNVMSMGGGFDPNDPLGSMKKNNKNVDKCCVERDICKQTCGTTAKECHVQYWACTKKICKGDQNCDLGAMMGGFDAYEADDEKKDPPEAYDYEKDKQKRECRGFEKAQNQVCKCVPQAAWQTTTEENLKGFYKTHNPEKLDNEGNIKDIADVWKKWKGKEPQMFQALNAKYKKKAVMIKTKPKPPPYKPPPPLSKEEQAKEDKRMADNSAKWAKEDAVRDAERAEREQKQAEEREERERQKSEEADGETVEL